MKNINNIAYIVQQICNITGSHPVKKTVQKMIFLLEEKGVKLGYDYILHLYGPYCAELDQETNRLCADGLIDFEYSKYGHRMHINDDFEKLVQTDLPEAQLILVREVITHCSKMQPMDLELLTTAIYAYRHISGKSKVEVAQNVKKIKGSKFSDEEIESALSEFLYFGIYLQ